MEHSRHPFFRLTEQQQNKFVMHAVLLALFALAIVGFIFYLLGILPLMLLVFAMGLTLLAPFVDMPGGIREGKLRYLSPFLIAEKERKGVIVVHAATLFDYYFLFDKTMPVAQRKRAVQQGMLEGVLQLISEYEHKDEEDVEGLKVRTTSYIINARTAAKLGMQQQPTDGLQLMILYYNYFNLTASYSMLHKQLKFPSVKSVQTFEGSISELIKRKPLLLALQKRYTG